MVIDAKSPEQLALMREAGKIVAEVLDALEAACVPGVTTAELDRLAAQLTAKRKAKPAFKGYGPAECPFPACVCISINEEVVHGIPGRRRVAEGDLVKLDFGVSYQGWFGDSARTVCVGAVSDEARRLVEATKQALARAIDAARAGKRVGDVSFAVQSYVEGLGYSVVRDFTGHGIGRALHERPQVPNFGARNGGVELRPGMTIALEPMVNAGTPKVEILDDDWTAVTLDRRLSAHFEHTIAITEGTPEILTLP